ncbi:MAG: hypothetical protein JOZ77_08180 [Candidatus Eremiobacteraeota bacterium]|nr:hypothetical protein [Candidatus Eremiobacteraeota bacterium]
MTICKYSIPRGGSLLHGFDVSIFVNRIDWPTVAASTDARFAFLECARGTEVGPQFSSIWDTRIASIKCGPYQRLFSTISGKEQAQVFSDAMRAAGLLKTDLPPVLDLEADPDGTRATPGQYLILMNEWIATIRDQLGRQPVIYTNPSFWKYLGNPSQFERFPLWIAHYNVETPDIPQPWTTYAFWQYQQSAQISGIDKPVDLDVFYGEETDFQQLTQSSVI